MCSVMEAVMEWRPGENGSMDGLPPLLMREADISPPPPLVPDEELPNGIEDRQVDEGEGEAPQSYIDCYEDIRVLSQSVAISHLDMLSNSFYVYTVLSVLPLDPNLASIFLNLGQNAKLPNELPGSQGRVTVNGIEARYERLDVFDKLQDSCPTKTVTELRNAENECIRNHDGDLRIQIPPQLLPLIRRLTCVKVAIEVQVENAFRGVQFNTTLTADGQLDKSSHAFTYRSGLLSSTSEWLPCLDCPDQLSLWTFHFTCDATQVVVMSGELLDVELSYDLKEKTYHYQQVVPTAPTNVGWAVGSFVPHVHRDMGEMTNFALVGLSSLVRHTVATLDRTFEYFEELLSCRYPFPSYKQVFVDKLADDVVCYSSLSLVSMNVLYHKKVIDVVQQSRQILAFAVAQQFFGCFISPSEFLDMWIVKSLSRFITSLYVEKVFGKCEYMYQVKKTLNAVCEYESQWGKVFLRPSLNSPLKSHSNCRWALTCSPLHTDILFKKGELVMRMLSRRLGHEPFFQVLHKILSVGEQMRERREHPACWTYLIVSTDAFFRTLSNVTGHDIPTFLEHWIYGGGHAHFEVLCAFNRKRNMIELEICQNVDGKRNGRFNYLGPLTVVVQELDGSFTHTLQIDAQVSRHELQCHSKGRRQKRKKVPLQTGEEVEVDLTNMDPDSPVMWIRVDPELLLLRSLDIRQPAYQWEYMLKYERDSVAQLMALDRIEQFPSASSRVVLIDTINNSFFFYRVRCRAAYSLSHVMNKMSEMVCGPPPLLTLFGDLFGCKSAPHIPKSNNFVATSSNLQSYFLMQVIPQSAALLRTGSSEESLPEVHSFLLDLIYYNDNSMNRYSDDFYRACLLSALSSTIGKAELLGDTRTPSSLSPTIESTLKELTLALNMDTLRPSFGRVVGIAALHGIYMLQKWGHLPHDSAVFWKFAQPNVFVQMRKCALWILVDRLSNVKVARVDDLFRLLSVSQEDVDPAIRRYVPTLLAKYPPFSYRSSDGNHPLNVPQVTDFLWALISSPKTECTLRALLVDMWYSLFGWSSPSLDVPPDADGMVRFIPATASVPDPLISWHSSNMPIEPPSSPNARFEESLHEDTLQ